MSLFLTMPLSLTVTLSMILSMTLSLTLSMTLLFTCCKADSADHSLMGLKRKDIDKNQLTEQRSLTAI